MQNMNIRKSQGGFTLIELVIVIVILGILAAVAVPRFLDLTNEAEAATCDGINGALLSTAAINLADPNTGTGGTGSPGSLQDIVDNTDAEGWSAPSGNIDTTACTIDAQLDNGTACSTTTAGAVTIPSELNSDC